MVVLGIETSCDETAAAVMGEQGLLSHEVASQVGLHAAFGGVVPEMASRRHMEVIARVVAGALERAGKGPGDLGAVAVTRGPGLLGSLMVGVSFAKGMALSLDVPLVGVNHILGHVHGALLGQQVALPALALVVSGGHTDLLRVDGPTQVTVLGRSRDDAAGEAFDKVARRLSLPYPGGPALEALAERGDPEAARLPDVRLEEGSLDFSFSGLKTAAARLLDQGIAPADVAAVFQAKVAGYLVRQTRLALSGHPVRTLILGGGVSANAQVRSGFSELARTCGVRLVMPEKEFCTDNAAMIAAAGRALLQEGATCTLDLTPEPVISPFRP